jgi:hypothetical protein
MPIRKEGGPTTSSVSPIVVSSALPCMRLPSTVMTSASGWCGSTNHSPTSSSVAMTNPADWVMKKAGRGSSIRRSRRDASAMPAPSASRKMPSTVGNR